MTSKHFLKKSKLKLFMICERKKAPFRGAFLKMSVAGLLLQIRLTIILINIFYNSGYSLPSAYTSRYNPVFLLLSF
jgi:hypothetical protein